MTGFGYKQAWLAVRDGEPAAVAQALGLREIGTAPWRTGIDMSYLTDDRLAMTPPLRGARDSRWLLVTGQWLLLHGDQVDVVRLSAALDTEVQRFATHRVAEAHEWLRAEAGALVRAFGYVGERGEVTRWQGEPEPVELELGLPADLGSTQLDECDVIVDEGDVMRVAAAWSVDPTGLDGQPAPGPLLMFAAPPTRP